MTSLEKRLADAASMGPEYAESVRRYQNKTMISLFECAECGDEIEINFSISKETIRCTHCGTLHRVNVDAEFLHGMWVDKTKLTKISRSENAQNKKSEKNFRA